MSTSTTAIATGDGQDLDAVQPYGMHVSARYLELTKRKLQLTRLPREIELPEERRWEYGTPKAVLEPLIDFWLEKYDWRTQESLFNKALPQFRTTIPLSTSTSATPHSAQPPTPSLEAPTSPTSPTNPTSPSAQSSALRLHFVHKSSPHRNAIPLLYIHSWPSSFVELYKIIDALTDPVSLPSYGSGAQQAFHVVAPSIPGFGFSDASTVEGFGLRETAEAFHGVMGRLGYLDGDGGGYVACGSGWGFKVCRALALHHPHHCRAIHTTNPTFDAPKLTRRPLSWLKYNTARLTKARLSFLSFGYLPSDFQRTQPAKSNKRGSYEELETSSDPSEMTLAAQYSQRSQTSSYALCDSPIGLLACVLDAVHSHSTSSSSSSPPTSRARSPFLSPDELSQETPLRAGRSTSDIQMEVIPEEQESVVSPVESERSGKRYTWKATEVVDWAMMQWLPGPEAGLRWLRRATLDSSPNSYLQTTYSSVPLGISQFRSRHETSTASPLMWAEATQKLVWVKRHQRSARWPAWEAPDLLVLDLRECFGGMRESGAILFPKEEGNGR